jgi:glycosyltransferase involved in cell wall biosynthesis
MSDTGAERAPAFAGRRDARIVHLLPITGGGGAEKQALYLLKELQTRFAGLELVCFQRGVDHAQFEELGLPIRVLRPRRRLALDLLPRAIRLRRLLAGPQPDLIHTWLFEAHLVGLLAATMWRHPPRVVVGHRAGIGGPREGRHLTAMRPFRRRIDLAVANSASGADLMRRLGVPRHQVVVVPNGIPSERVQIREPPEKIRAAFGLHDAGPVVCSVTRISQAKDIPTLYEAFDMVRAAEPNAQLLIVGPTANELEQSGFRPPTGAVVVGYQNHPADFLNAADVVVISSRTEGYSNAAAEAILLGKPVATTDVGDHVAIVRAAKGRVTPPGGGAHLARAILELFAQPPRPAEVCCVGRAALDIGAVTDRIASLYQEVLR